MTSAKSNEQTYYDALRAIGHGFQTPEQLRQNAHKIGLSPEEHVEHAYENIQSIAKIAIRGKRRPK